MIALILSWTLIFLVCTLWGKGFYTIASKLKLVDSGVKSAIDLFFVGLVIIGIFISIISLFAPINILVLGLVLGLSLLALLCNIAWLVDSTKSSYQSVIQLSIGYKFVLILALISILLLGLCTPLMFDQGLYHLQAMMWTQEYPVVMGLGNLHGRLAFNSNFLLLSTLFNYHPSYSEPFFSLNSLVLAVFAIWLVMQQAKAELAKRLCLLIVLVTSIFSFSVYLSSSSTDIITNILVFYVFLSVLQDGGISKNRKLTIFLIACFCITLKLSSALVLLVAIWILILQVRRRSFKGFSVFVILGLLIALPWLSRYIILSGYLVYPFPSIDIFSFDWKIPLANVQLEKDLAFVWPIASELPVEEVLSMSLAKWFPIWVKKLSLFNFMLYGLALMSPVMILILSKFKQLSTHVLVLWLIAFVAAYFGFFTAPDPRFSFAFIVLSWLIPLSSFKFGGFKQTSLCNGIYLTFAILALLWLTKISATQLTHYQQGDVYELVLKPQSIIYKKNEVNVSFSEILLDGSILLYAPQGGVQCFDQVLPCTPYYHPNLVLRGKNLSSGFRVKSKE